MFERDLGDGWKVSETVGPEGCVRLDLRHCSMLMASTGMISHDPLITPSIQEKFAQLVAEWESSNA